MVTQVAGQEAYEIRSDKSPEEEIRAVMLFMRSRQYILVEESRQRGTRSVVLAVPVFRPEAGEPPQLEIQVRRSGTGSMLTVSSMAQNEGELARQLAEQLADFLQSGHRPRGTHIQGSGGRTTRF